MSVAQMFQTIIDVVFASIIFALLLLLIALFASGTWNHVSEVLERRARKREEQKDSELRERVIVEREKALRLVSRDAGEDGSRYENLVMFLEGISPELHLQALKNGDDPWGLYHPEIRALLRQKGVGKSKVIRLDPRPPNDVA